MSKLKTQNQENYLRFLKDLHKIIRYESSKSLRVEVVTQLESLLYKATSQCDCDQVSEDFVSLRNSLLEKLKDRLMERFEESQADVIDQLLEVADPSLVNATIILLKLQKGI